MTRLKTAAREAIFSSFGGLPVNIFSTSAKFSRHLIFHLPGAVFKDNIHAGETDMLWYDFIFTISTVCIYGSYLVFSKFTRPNSSPAVFQSNKFILIISNWMPGCPWPFG